MKIKLIALAIITLLAQSICAQNIFKAIVKDGDTKEILVGVNAVLNKTANGASSDENGIITISNIPDGKQHITFSYLGYESETKSYTFPLSSSAPVEIFLEQDDEMLKKLPFLQPEVHYSKHLYRTGGARGRRSCPSGGTGAYRTGGRLTAELVAHYPEHPFKTGNMQDTRNPDIGLMLPSGQIQKFHLCPLAEVIARGGDRRCGRGACGLFRAGLIVLCRAHLTGS